MHCIGERGCETVMKISVKSLVTFEKHFTKKSQDAVKIKLGQSREICCEIVGEKVVKTSHLKMR